MAWPTRRPFRQQRQAFQQAYRIWRAERLAALDRKSASDDRSTSFSYENEGAAQQLRPLRQARDRLEALREEVMSDLRWNPSVEHLPMMRKALGIPVYVSMTRPWWLILAWGIVTPFIPHRMQLMAGGALLRRTRSYLGREYVYERVVVPVWSIQSSYSGGVDRALRKLPLAHRASAYHRLIGLEGADIDVMVRLGLNDVGGIPDAWHDVRRSYELSVIHALIDEGVLERLDDLRWVPNSQRLPHRNTAEDRRREVAQDGTRSEVRGNAARADPRDPRSSLRPQPRSSLRRLVAVSRARPDRCHGHV